MSEASVDQVAEAMLVIVKDYYGKKNLKALDLTKMMIEKFGADNCDKKLCKLAIRQLMETGKTTYNYVGGSYITLPPEN